MSRCMWRCNTSRREMWRCKMSRPKMWRCKMSRRKMWRCKMSKRQMWRCKMSRRKMSRREMWRFNTAARFFEEPYAQTFSGKTSPQIEAAWEVGHGGLTQQPRTVQDGHLGDTQRQVVHLLVELGTKQVLCKRQMDYEILKSPPFGSCHVLYLLIWTEHAAEQMWCWTRIFFSLGSMPVFCPFSGQEIQHG